MSGVIKERNELNYIEQRKQEIKNIIEKHSLKVYGHTNATIKNIREKNKLVRHEITV